RRRRRGNSDAVTVAELTGEIPIVGDDTATTGRTPARTDQRPSSGELVEEASEEPTEAPADDPVVEAAPEPEAEAEPEPVLTEAEADYAAHLEQRDVDPAPLDFAPPPRRPQVGKPIGFGTAQGSGAEQMSPDPAVDDEEMLDLGPDVDFTEVLDKHSSSTDDDVTADDDGPSYLRSSSGTLFGGQSVADDLARRGPQPGPEDIDLGGTESESKVQEPSREELSEEGGSAFVWGAWVVAQCILAVAFGAGLFIAFDQLWRWNTIVALVLSVLVILGLVVGVRVVRKTEDIGSTLIAVAVGALVTLGPLALLQSH
ncbi:MAG: hypothetical protein ACRDUX_37755, partial [Mycobacterium sp.]